MTLMIEKMSKRRSMDEIIAYWVSNLISPHYVAIALSCYFTLQYSHHPHQALFWLFFLICFTVIPPLSYIYWLVYVGYLEDVHMPNRERRFKPLVVTISWLMISVGLSLYWQISPIVEMIAIITLTLTCLLAIITLFWKISFHSATISAASIGTLMITGYQAWPLLFLIPLVGWSRVRLKRHTPKQVIMGSIAGLMVAWLMIKFNWFYGMLLG